MGIGRIHAHRQSGAAWPRSPEAGSPGSGTPALSGVRAEVHCGSERETGVARSHPSQSESYCSASPDGLRMSTPERLPFSIMLNDPPRSHHADRHPAGLVPGFIRSRPARPALSRGPATRPPGRELRTAGTASQGCVPAAPFSATETVACRRTQAFASSAWVRPRCRRSERIAYPRSRGIVATGSMVL